MSEYRQDPITGRWVIIAPSRNARPWHINVAPRQERIEPCPFCAGNEAMTPSEIWAERDPSTQANTPGWRVRVVANKYPALKNHGEEFSKTAGFYRSMNGVGVHEVIIESPEHVVDMTMLDHEQWVRILSAYRARLGALKQDCWRYALVYKNHRERAGATFEHVHSQLVALPFVPREAQDEIDGARTHFEATRRCIYCEIVEHVSEDRTRLVLQSDRFVAFCPFAPRFGYETWIVPRKHAANFDLCSDADIAALAESWREFTARLNRVSDNAPFNFVIHTAPDQEPADERFHWHVEILPQVTRAAGFEWGTGMHMNSVAPEEAARLLRDGAL